MDKFSFALIYLNEVVLAGVVMVLSFLLSEL